MGLVGCARMEIMTYCVVLQLEAFWGKYWCLINLHLEGKLDYLKRYHLKLLFFGFLVFSSNLKPLAIILELDKVKKGLRCYLTSSHSWFSSENLEKLGGKKPSSLTVNRVVFFFSKYHNNAG